MSGVMQIFERHALRQHRDRAAAHLAEHDFLFAESAERLCDRLDDVKRSFPMALDLGCHGGEVARVIGKRGGVETLVQCDLSPQMVKAAGGLALAADEERLPFADGSFDLVLSNLSLHWVNDLPGALIQVRRALKPDGLLLACVLAEDTLYELRESLMAAEMELEMGISPRTSPLATVQDLGALLQRAGFALPVVDTDTITVSYPDAFKLMRDLRFMGEAGAVVGRRKNFSRRATLMRAAQYYQDKFAGPDGRIPATFTIATLTAWTPHPDQPQPLKPGTAAVNLAEALSAVEQPDENA